MAFLQSWGLIGREWALTLVPASLLPGSSLRLLWPELLQECWLVCPMPNMFSTFSQSWSCPSLASKYLKALRIKFKNYSHDWGVPWCSVLLLLCLVISAPAILRHSQCPEFGLCILASSSMHILCLLLKLLALLSQPPLRQHFLQSSWFAPMWCHRSPTQMWDLPYCIIIAHLFLCLTHTFP